MRPLGAIATSSAPQTVNVGVGPAYTVVPVDVWIDGDKDALNGTGIVIGRTGHYDLVWSALIDVSGFIGAGPLGLILCALLGGAELPDNRGRLDADWRIAADDPTMIGTAEAVRLEAGDVITFGANAFNGAGTCDFEATLAATWKGY